MTTRCKAGDLAVVISAYNQENLGQIISVIEPYANQGPVVFGENDGFIWFCESAMPMVWQVKDRYYRARQGPVPDSCLKPLRGQAKEMEQSLAESLVE